MARVADGGLERRCQDGVTCVEVTARLESVRLAREYGIDNEAAVHRILQWARWHADAHQHGTDRSQP
jgi:hypothetical protein